jgi:hypothetical protein
MTNENNQTQDKKYKVLLVEDSFFGGRETSDIEKISSELEKKLSEKTTHSINLEITPDVEKALTNVKTGDYDLVVTDVGLTYPYDDSHSSKGYWKSKLPKVHTKMKDNLAKNKNSLEEEIGFTFDKIKDKTKGYKYEGHTNKRGEIVNSSLLKMFDWGSSAYYDEGNELEYPKITDEWGIEIYKESAKIPTVIFTDKGHAESSLSRLYIHKVISQEEVISLMKLYNGGRKNKFYIKNKKELGGTGLPSLDNFASVIDDAIDNFVEGGKK